MRQQASLFAMLAFVLVAVPAQAQVEQPQAQGRGIAPRAEDPHRRFARISDNRFYISIGSYRPSYRTVARVGSEFVGTGTKVDFERNLALNRATTNLKLEGHVRFGRRSRLQFAYYSLRRRTTTRTKTPIQFGDGVFDALVELDAVFNTTLLQGSYRYSLFNRARADVGLSGGVSAMFLQAGLFSDEAGTASIESQFVPLPTFGVDGEFSVAPNLVLKTGFNYFIVPLDQSRYEWRELRAALEYYPWEHYGFGAGYKLFDVDIAHERGTPTSVEFDYKFDGLHAYLVSVF